MERSRSGFENVNLKESIDSASGVLEETIHDDEKAEKGEKLPYIARLQHC
jgi:hypothetical protein